MSCLTTCLHHRIDSGLRLLAEHEEKELAKQKGANNPTTLKLSSRRDFIGSLAHNGVIERLKAYGLFVEYTPYFDPKRNKDEFDFMYDGEKIDIQGQPMGSFPDGTLIDRVFLKTRFLVKNDKEKKPMDRYVFAVVDLENWILHIAGIVSYNKLWKELDQEVTVRTPSHFVLASQLDSFHQYIMRV